MQSSGCNIDYRYARETILKIKHIISPALDCAVEDEIIAKNREYFQKFGVAFRKILVDPIELSSSEIRNVICAGGDISEMVPDAVMKYIYEHKLYE